MANMADVVIAVKDADFYVTTPSDVTADTCYEQGTVDILADDLDGALTAAKRCGGSAAGQQPVPGTGV